MTDSTPLPPPAPETRAPETKKKPSAGRIILTIVIVVVVVAGVSFATRAILEAVAPKTPESSPVATNESEPETEETPSESGESYRYTSTEYGFSVEFPSEPAENTQVQSIAGLEIPMLQLQWASGTDLALVQAASFPDEVANQDPNALLDGSMAGAATSSGGTLSEQSATELDGAPARIATLELANGQEARILIAMKGALQVSIMAIGDVSIDDLIDSFSFEG